MKGQTWTLLSQVLTSMTAAADATDRALTSLRSLYKQEPEAERVLLKKHGSWWRPNGAGYTDHVAYAGTYTVAEAESWCRSSGGEVTFETLSEAIGSTLARGNFDPVIIGLLAERFAPQIRERHEAELEAERTLGLRLSAELGDEKAKHLETLRKLEELEAERDSPIVREFLKGVQNEAAHQRARHGEDDAKKEPHHFFWLVGYLAGKALHRTGEQRMHHLVSAAAALFNWHRVELEREAANAARGAP